jgi:hypothetical protein
MDKNRIWKEQILRKSKEIEKLIFQRNHLHKKSVKYENALSDVLNILSNANTKTPNMVECTRIIEECLGFGIGDFRELFISTEKDFDFYSKSFEESLIKYGFIAKEEEGK